MKHTGYYTSFLIKQDNWRLLIETQFVKVRFHFNREMQSHDFTSLAVELSKVQNGHGERSKKKTQVGSVMVSRFYKLKTHQILNI